MPEHSSPRRVRLSSGRSAQLHTQQEPRPGDLVLIEYRGVPQLARHHRGRLIAPSGHHSPQDCRLLGVLEIER